MIGILVGSGFYDLEGYKPKTVETPYGSAEVLLKEGSNVALLARHGENHRYLPHHINYRANIAALQHIGCNAIISCSVVGSLSPEKKLGKAYHIEDLYYPDNRLPDGDTCSFFMTPGAPNRGHLIAGSLYNNTLNIWIKNTINSEPATYAYSIGPRFNTKLEIKAFQQAGCELISQTCGPEAVLTNELKTPYAQVAFAIDFANGVTDTPTSIEELQQNLSTSKDIFTSLIAAAEKEVTQSTFTNFVYEF